MKMGTNLDIYEEYRRAQEELLKDYQKIRDEFINGHLTKKLQLTYEEFKLKEKSLRNIYIEKRGVLHEKYFNKSKNTN